MRKRREREEDEGMESTRREEQAGGGGEVLRRKRVRKPVAIKGKSLIFCLFWRGRIRSFFKNLRR